MGKSLIIKGADFSANAIEDNDLMLYQGVIGTNPSGSTYGKIMVSGGSYRYYVYTKVLIPSGHSVKITLNKLGTQISTEPCTYLIATGNVQIPVQENTLIDGIIDSFYPVSTNMVQSDGTYKFENTTSSALYYYIAFGEEGTIHNVSNYSATYTRI